MMARECLLFCPCLCFHCEGGTAPVVVAVAVDAAVLGEGLFVLELKNKNQWCTGCLRFLLDLLLASLSTIMAQCHGW